MWGSFDESFIMTAALVPRERLSSISLAGCFLIHIIN